MWKIVTGEQPPHSSCLLVTFTLVLLFYVAELPSSSHCMPFLSSDGRTSLSSSSVDMTPSGPGVAQFQNLIREALKLIHKMNSSGGGGSGEAARISGQMNLRYPRSEIGDVAHRLSYLQELDRKFSPKARTRFGKRNEVTQDNFIPMYSEDELRESQNGAKEDNRPSLLFIP